MAIGVLAAVGVSLLISIVVGVTMMLLMPKPKAKPPAIQESSDVPTAREGAEIMVIFGTVLIENANNIAHGNKRTEAIKKKM